MVVRLFKTLLRIWRQPQRDQELVEKLTKLSEKAKRLREGRHG